MRQRWIAVVALVHSWKWMGLSMLVFLVNLVWSQLFVREPAEANPWNSKSAEWQLPTPVPVYDFERIAAQIGAGDLPVERVVTSSVTLDDAPDAFASLASGKADEIKVLIDQ